VFVHECLYTSVCTRVFVHECLYTSVCTRVFVHECLYTSVCTRVFVLTVAQLRTETTHNDMIHHLPTKSIQNHALK
jgi:hypothetical protein